MTREEPGQAAGGNVGRLSGDLQRAEHYRRLFDFAPVGIVYSDAAGYYLDANACICEMLGYTHDEFVGLHASDIIAPVQVPEIQSTLDEINRQSADYRKEWQFRRKDGSIIDAEVSVTKFADGTLLGMIRDVTTSRRLEAQLRQSQKMEAMGQLAGGVAHDFNNLLTVISGYSELLLGMPNLDRPVHDAVVAIRAAGERAASLTRQLLGFSRQTMLQPRVLNLNAVVSETASMLRRLIGEDILLSTVLAPDLQRVKVDPAQLDQVLMNLAVNARDAMPAGGRLTIETANVHLDRDYAATHLDCRAGPHVMLALTDTGSGIPPEVMARIFDPFFTTKERGKGTGLGLATVLGIVNQSDGCIHCYSEPGHGTSFKLYFPVVSDEADVPEEAAADHEVQGTETVLLVEDDESVREVALMSLEMYGFSVITAKDGAEALHLASHYPGRIDLLLTDLVMPHVSGAELAKSLSSRFPHMKILFMSGYTSDAVVRHGLLQATVSFIQKPYTLQGLARKVREVLDG